MVYYENKSNNLMCALYMSQYNYNYYHNKTNMNHNEISAILPPLNEDDREQHYINEPQQFQKSVFKLTGGNKQEQYEQNQQIEQNDQVIYQSRIHSHIYYTKKLMKQLLEQRNQIWQNLKLKPTKGLSIKNKTEAMIKQEKDIVKNLKQIFKDCPTVIQQISVVHIRDCLAIYTFFSSDGRYIPQCKKCNNSVYIITRYDQCKIVCSNNSCKLKVLGEYMMVETDKNSLNKSHKITENSQMSKNSSIKPRSSQSHHRALTKQQMASIKKATQKIVYS